MSGLLPRRSRQLELGIAVAMIALFSVFLLKALSQLQEESEKLLVELTIRHINIGLTVEQRRYMIAGREAELALLARSNPIMWLEKPPAGYMGARVCATEGLLAPGQWCWDADSRMLFYRPRRIESLKIDGNLPWLTWRVPLSDDGRAIRPGAIRLVPANSYTWSP